VMADILFALICMANEQAIDLGENLEHVTAKVWARDRDRYR
jgi:NTP pyrophosphatase (non-canonical NTP hydrolase)